MSGLIIYLEFIVQACDDISFAILSLIVFDLDLFLCGQDHGDSLCAWEYVLCSCVYDLANVVHFYFMKLVVAKIKICWEYIDLCDHFHVMYWVFTLLSFWHFILYLQELHATSSTKLDILVDPICSDYKLFSQMLYTFHTMLTVVKSTFTYMIQSLKKKLSMQYNLTTLAILYSFWITSWLKYFINFMCRETTSTFTNQLMRAHFTTWGSSSSVETTNGLNF